MFHLSDTALIGQSLRRDGHASGSRTPRPACARIPGPAGRQSARQASHLSDRGRRFWRLRCSPARSTPLIGIAFTSIPH